MHKRPAIFFLLLFIGVIPGMAQSKIIGTVVDGVTGEPLQGASVFINSSSIGTMTDKGGHFELPNLPPGKQEVVCSSIGYETNAYAYSPEQLPLKLRIQMEKKVRELKTVVVEPSVLEGWNKWGWLFTDEFIGTVPNAKRCKIKNRKAIKFRYFPNSDRLVAWCDEPIILENEALGYTIRYQLEDFELNFRTHTTEFAGYPFFIDHNKDKDVSGHKGVWIYNRDQAYYGSMMHFMRSLYHNTLTSEGFAVRRMTRKPNVEKERVKQLLPAVAGRDSSDYYERIMNEPNDIDTYSPFSMEGDSLLIGEEGPLKILWFTDYIYVTYSKAMEDPLYYHDRNLEGKPSIQGSHITLVSGNPVTVDANGGYSPPNEVFSMSYWGWSEKMSNLVPLDFEPSRPKD